MSCNSNNFQRIEKILRTSSRYLNTVKILSRSDKNCSRFAGSRMENLVLGKTRLRRVYRYIPRKKEIQRVFRLLPNEIKI